MAFQTIGKLFKIKFSYTLAAAMLFATAAGATGLTGLNQPHATPPAAVNLTIDTKEYNYP